MKTRDFRDSVQLLTAERVREDSAASPRPPASAPDQPIAATGQGMCLPAKCFILGLGWQTGGRGQHTVAKLCQEGGPGAM